MVSSGMIGVAAPWQYKVARKLPGGKALRQIRNQYFYGARHAGHFSLEKQVYFQTRNSRQKSAIFISANSAISLREFSYSYNLLESHGPGLLCCDRIRTFAKSTISHVGCAPFATEVEVRRNMSRRASRRRKQSQQDSYSITSSARSRIADGSVRPSALAVLRLIISSTFTACCTGRSAGLSPLRMRPA